MTPEQLKTAALEWAKRGVPVFPLNADNEPTIAGGFHSASTDPAVISRMRFTHGIGGVPGAAGYVVIDVDAKHGATLADLPDAGGDSMRYKTRSDGWHVWYRAAPGVDYGNGKRPDIAPAIDARFDRGYVALAPTPGYELQLGSWSDPESIRPAPAYAAKPADSTASRIFGLSETLDDRDTIPSGEQEAAVHARAFQIARHRPRPSENEATAMLWAFIQDRCPNTPGKRPWSEGDAREKIVNAYKVPIDSPIAVAPERGELEVRSLVGVKRKVAELYPGSLNIPVGTISILTGQQGTGKGLLEVAEIAQVSQRHGVLIASDEDSIEHTILPRLVAAGARIENLGMVQSLKLPDDTDGLVRRCLERDVRLVVVDPWTNHVGDMDVNKGTELRAALMALKDAADRSGFVALLTAHPNKNSMNPDPLERVAHSQALTQVARSAFYIVKDPEYRPGEHGTFETDDYPNRIVAQIKANLTPFAPSRVYRLRTRLLTDPVQSIAYLDYAFDSDYDWLTLHKLAAERDREKVHTAKGDAATWLLELLSHGPMMPADVYEQGLEDGHREATIRRARRTLTDEGRLADTRKHAPWSLPIDQGDEHVIDDRLID